MHHKEHPERKKGGKTAGRGEVQGIIRNIRDKGWGEGPQKEETRVHEHASGGLFNGPHVCALRLQAIYYCVELLWGYRGDTAVGGAAVSLRSPELPAASGAASMHVPDASSEASQRLG